MRPGHRPAQAPAVERPLELEDDRRRSAQDDLGRGVALDPGGLDGELASRLGAVEGGYQEAGADSLTARRKAAQPRGRTKPPLGRSTPTKRTRLERSVPQNGYWRVVVVAIEAS